MNLKTKLIEEYQALELVNGPHLTDELISQTKTEYHKKRTRADFSTVLQPVKNLIRAAQWNSKGSDQKNVINTFGVINKFSQIKKWLASRALVSGNWNAYYKHELDSYKLCFDYESKIERIWRDQRSGTKWTEKHPPTSEQNKFNPHKVSIAGNKILSPSIHFIAGWHSHEIDTQFNYTASGLSGVKVYTSQSSLGNENARAKNTFVTAYGNVVKSGALFSKLIASNTIKEFGGTNSVSDPSIFLWRVRLKHESEWLVHEQNDLNYNAIHTTIYSTDY
jgi:hypothetical protein